MPDDDRYDELTYIIERLEDALKQLDHIDLENPVEEHITAGYAEIEKARDIAKKLRSALPYSEE